MWWQAGQTLRVPRIDDSAANNHRGLSRESQTQSTPDALTSGQKMRGELVVVDPYDNPLFFEEIHSLESVSSKLSSSDAVIVMAACSITS